MFHFASKGGYYLSAAFIQERPLIEHIRYAFKLMFYDWSKSFNFDKTKNGLFLSDFKQKSIALEKAFQMMCLHLSFATIHIIHL